MEEEENPTPTRARLELEPAGSVGSCVLRGTCDGIVSEVGEWEVGWGMQQIRAE